jgi:hypothetical protein
VYTFVVALCAFLVALAYRLSNTSRHPSSVLRAVFVINLRSRVDRRNHVTKALAAEGLEGITQFIDATTPADLGSDFKRMPDNDWVMPNSSFPFHRNPIQLTEVATTVSHLRCWEEAAALDGPSLILEDDVVFSPVLSFEEYCHKFLANTLELDPLWDMLYLFHSPVRGLTTHWPSYADSNFVYKPGFSYQGACYRQEAIGCTQYMEKTYPSRLCS